MMRNTSQLLWLFGVLNMTAVLAALFWARHMMRRIHQTADLRQKNRYLAIMLSVPLAVYLIVMAGLILYARSATK